MADLIAPEDQRRLAERLRREAEAERPAFSETLHRRIVAGLARRDIKPRPTAARRLGPRTWLTAALVASVAVAATIAVSRYVDRGISAPAAPQETVVVMPSHALPDHISANHISPDPQPSEQPELDPLDAELDPLEVVAGVTAQGVGSLVDDALRESQWAYLDHDARLAADMMLAQIPLDFELPAEEEIEQ